MENENCEWHLDDEEGGAWESACGQLWCFEDGDPEDNGMKFCPFCGRHLTQRALDECPSCDGEGTGFSEGESWTCSVCDGTGIRQ